MIEPTVSIKYAVLSQAVSTQCKHTTLSHAALGFHFQYAHSQFTSTALSEASIIALT